MTSAQPLGGATATPVEEPLLAVSHLERSFTLPRQSLLGPRRRLRAVQDVSLALQRGERLGIVGESGSGKSTLARMLVALDRPDSGSIRYRGREITGLSERDLRDFRRDCQIVFQDPVGSLDPRMRVRSIITEPLRALGIDEDPEARLSELLEAVALPAEAADRYPHEFSGGQRQRIAIARALAPRPKVLIADELVSALDVSVRAQILNLLFDLGESYDLTLVLISHDLSVVHRVCDRVAVMYLGSVVELGPTGALFGAPEHPYTRALLEAIPTLDSALPTPPPPSHGRASPAEPPAGCAYTTRCPLVHDRCHVEAPALRGPADPPVEPAHLAACHLAFGPNEEDHPR